MTNPALPKLDSQLVQNFFEPGSADTSPRFGLTVFNDQTAIVLGTNDFGNRSPRAGPVDDDRRLEACHAQRARPDHDPSGEPRHRHCIAGKYGSDCWKYRRRLNPGVVNQATNTVSFPFTGDLTLHSVDFTNPLSGVILGMLVTPYQATSGSPINPLGREFFSITFAPPLIDLRGRRRWRLWTRGIRRAWWFIRSMESTGCKGSTLLTGICMRCRMRG